MRVCFFAYNPCVHHAQLLREASALAGRGDEVEIVAFHQDGLQKVQQRDGFTIRRVRRDPLDQRLKRLARALRGRVGLGAKGPGRQRPRGFIRKQLQLLDYSRKAYALAKRRPADVYHAMNLVTLPVAYAAARRSGARLVYDSRELWADRAMFPGLQKRYWWAIERLLIKRADLVITPCQSFGDQLVKRYGIQQPEIIRSCPVIPPGGLEVGRNGETLRRRAGLDGTDEPIVLYQGRIQAERGLHDLIAAAHLLDRGVVVILGLGAMKEELRRTVAAQGLADRVRVVDEVPPDELLRYTAGATIGVAPIEGNHLSYLYSSPNKLFEYLAAGLPIVATRLPEMERVIEEHDVGLLCEPGDAQGLAAALNRLLSDAELYERCRRNALAASKVFNWGSESKRLIALYEGLR